MKQVANTSKIQDRIVAAEAGDVARSTGRSGSAWRPSSPDGPRRRVCLGVFEKAAATAKLEGRTDRSAGHVAATLQLRLRAAIEQIGKQVRDDSGTAPSLREVRDLLLVSSTYRRGGGGMRRTHRDIVIRLVWTQ